VLGRSCHGSTQAAESSLRPGFSERQGLSRARAACGLARSALH
jgi:hypothetical protein